MKAFTKTFDCKIIKTYIYILPVLFIFVLLLSKAIFFFKGCILYSKYSTIRQLIRCTDVEVEIC